MRLQQFIKHLTYRPRHAKPADHHMLRLFMPSIMGSILCMVCLIGTTWAWFSTDIQTKPQIMTAANYDVEVSISPAISETEGVYTLTAGQRYTVTLMAYGEVSTGYCKVTVNSKDYYTIPLPPGGQPLTFAIDCTQLSADGNAVFTPHWMTRDESTDDLIGETLDTITAENPNSNAILFIESPEAVPNTDASAMIHVIQSGDTLSKIAQQYNTSAEKLAAYNNITNPYLLQIGQKIQIPPTDYELPVSSAVLPNTTESQSDGLESAPSEPSSEENTSSMSSGHEDINLPPISESNDSTSSAPINEQRDVSSLTDKNNTDIDHLMVIAE